jgi:hypothetical protein
VWINKKRQFGKNLWSGPLWFNLRLVMLQG